MKKTLMLVLLAVLLPLAFHTARAQAESEPGYYTIADQGGSGYADDDLLYPEELDDLLAPIALYADPLIAQILPAATFVDQIHDAANFVRAYGNSSRIDYEPWDISVRAVAHYPQVLYMMDRDYQWTASLGQAYIEQPQDVMDAIQRLRRYAQAMGNLYSTREQQVIFDGDYIRIIPGRPEYVYVPVYDPSVVYVERYYPSSPFITFSVGFSIGPWLNRDCNWRDHKVYYHGWRGSGWVSRSRPYVHDRRGVYINKRAATITINQRVVQRDTRNYRERLRVESRRHRDEGRMPPVRSRAEQPRPGKVEQARPGRVEQTRPGKLETAPRHDRRREPWNRQPAATPAAPATGGAATKPGTPPVAPRQPAPAQPRGERVQPPATPVKPQAAPVQPPAQPGKQPQAQPGKQQAPAAAGEPATTRRGRGEERRREPRPVNRPAAPPAGTRAPTPENAAPAHGAAPHAPANPEAAPAVRGAAPHAPAAEHGVRGPAAAPAGRVPAATPTAPTPPARPAAPPRPAQPRVEPAPAPAQAPRAEPAEPARPARDFDPGERRGRGESPGGRGMQRGE